MQTMTYGVNDTIFPTRRYTETIGAQLARRMTRIVTRCDAARLALDDRGTNDGSARGEGTL